jgi:hypothetical protein
MYKYISLTIVLFTIFGFNSISTKTPIEITSEFLKSIHEGDFSKSKTFVDGTKSFEMIDEIEELWRVNKGSFIQNPNYLVTLESKNDNESIVRVKDEFNNLRIQLLKLNGNWKIVMRSCGVIDLVRGNTRTKDTNPEDYTIEEGDLGEGISEIHNSPQQETKSYYNPPKSNINSSTNHYVGNRNSSEQSENIKSCIICKGTGVFNECIVCKNKGIINCIPCKGKRMNYDGSTCLHCRGTGIEKCVKCQGKTPPFICPHSILDISTFTKFVLKSKK